MNAEGKGGFRPLARAAGLAGEGVVGEWVHVQQYEPADSRRDRIARWAFEILHRLQDGQPVTRSELAPLRDKERAYWAADEQADNSVVGHVLEHVEICEEIEGLLEGAASA